MSAINTFDSLSIKKIYKRKHCDNSDSNNKKIRAPSSWQSNLPKVLLESISSFLRPVEIANSIKVCNYWSEILNDNFVWNLQTHRLGLNYLSQVRAILCRQWGAMQETRLGPNLLNRIAQFDNLKIENAKSRFTHPLPAIAFGRQEWIGRGLEDPGLAPPLPAMIHEVLQSPCPFWKGKMVGETHALVLIAPGTIHSLNRQVQKYGIDILYSGGGKKTEEPYWVLMTKKAVPGSESKTFAQQEAMVHANGYSVPSVYEATTVAMTEYTRSRTQLFNGTYIRCKMQKGQAIVGNFDEDKEWEICNDCDECFEEVGMAGLLKLPASKN